MENISSSKERTWALGALGMLGMEEKGMKA